MTIIKLEPEENGAYANQTINGRLSFIPDGWTELPESLSGKADLLPWVILITENGAITDILPNNEAREAFLARREQELKEAEADE